MRKTLFLKFSIAYIIFLFFGYVIVTLFVNEMAVDLLKNQKAKDLYKSALILAEGYALDLYNNETSLTSLKEEIDIMSTMLDSEIWVINPSGLVILNSSEPVNVDNPRTIEGFNTLSMMGSYYTVGKFYNSFESETLSIAAPITSGYSVMGYVMIHYPMEIIKQQSNSMLNIAYMVLMILFLLSFIILIFFIEMVYLPLRKITKATEEYAAGNLSYELSVDSDDEVGYLAATVSLMAKEFARGEDNQKHMVANVSHDFRSPLTSIKGYLEAIQDGTIPPEMYEKYIGVVINETERLIKLTNSLLSLNNLDNQGMVLDKTDFDINKVIRNTVSTFEGRCIEKKIAIELLLTGDIMKVLADKTRIQQVLYNLIDNAIKFSHKNSVIKIETREKNNKLFVSVKDSGIGIPKDSINLVWDRFYKTDLSRGKDKKGTGLGLAITKEIIKSHNENINVTSTEGVGTEFTFSLPLSKEMEEDEVVE